MLLHTLLIIHISAATIGLLSGFLAVALRKGSGRHGAAGTVFFVSMLVMTSSAAYIAAFLKPNRLNVIAATLTFYLVSTAWRAAKRREGGITAFDFGALLFILAVGLSGIYFGFAALNRPAGNDLPAMIYFIFGTGALLCAVTDIRMIGRGGFTGTPRIVRHLWRMCMALLIATFSFYPGQAKLFPLWLRQTNLLILPAILLFGTMIFWRVRYRRKRVAESAEAIRVTPGPGPWLGGLHRDGVGDEIQVGQPASL